MSGAATDGERGPIADTLSPTGGRGGGGGGWGGGRGGGKGGVRLWNDMTAVA